MKKRVHEELVTHLVNSWWAGGWADSSLELSTAWTFPSCHRGIIRVPASTADPRQFVWSGSGFSLWYGSGSDPTFHFDTDPDPDSTTLYSSGSGSLLFQRGNVPKKVIFINLNLVFLVCRSSRSQTAGILCNIFRSSYFCGAHWSRIWTRILETDPGKL